MVQGLLHDMSLKTVLHECIASAQKEYSGLPREEFEALVQETLKTLINPDTSAQEIDVLHEVATIRVGESELDTKRMIEENCRVRDLCVGHIVEFVEKLKQPSFDRNEMRAFARALGDYF